MDSTEQKDYATTCRRKSRLLSELMSEAHQISMVQQADPGFLPHSKMLLMEEILRVYRLVNPACTAPQSISTTNIQKDTKITSSPTPAVDPQELSQTLIENMNRALNCITNSKHSSAPMTLNEETHQHAYTLNEKVFIPRSHGRKIKGSKCNFIGRIIGPAGMSVKQLESDTGCHILIRGRGSVKDPRKEQRLRGQPGWDHLEEPLHVLVTAVDHNHIVCQQKLRQGVESVRHLLTPAHDDYKRCQLMQLAIINGTYRQAQETTAHE
uniref:KH domain-containing protein n=1 Tax=Haemonchus contortus TaxID=6289 RepID=A0A7I5E8F1_HAECO